MLEGFVRHPAVQLVTEVEEADIIVWTTVMSNVESELVPTGCKRTVVIDCADGCR